MTTSFSVFPSVLNVLNAAALLAVLILLGWFVGILKRRRRKKADPK